MFIKYISDWKEIHNGLLFISGTFLCIEHLDFIQFLLESTFWSLSYHKKNHKYKYELLWCHYICPMIHNQPYIWWASSNLLILHQVSFLISLNKRWMRQWQHANSSKDAHSWHGMNMWCTTSSQGPFWPNKKTSKDLDGWFDTFRD